MDNITHSLVGALIGQTGLKRKTGLAMPAAIIGANLPDVDAACFFWLEGAEHLGFRRGITHGPPAWVLLPLVLAALLWGWDRWQTKRGTRPEGRVPVHFGWLYAIAFITCLSHPALDWLNVYGIRLLEPFSSQWFYGDTLFIIDIWLWAGMGLATWWSLRQEKRGGDWQRTGRIALTAACAYIAMNGVITLYSKGWQEPGDQSIVIASPVPFAFWKREEIVGNGFGEFFIDDQRVGNSTLLAHCSLKEVAKRDPEVRAFLFWSRAPFAERAEDGSVLLRDARFYDPRARDRFTVALPDVACEELPPQ